MSSAPVTLELPQASFWQRFSQSRGWHSWKRNPLAWLSLVLVLGFILMAVFAPWLVTHDINAANWLAIRQPPSAEHWLGTDELGRDIYSRLLMGARASLLAGVVSVLIAICIGVPLGLIAGYFGGYADMIISRCTEAMMAMPFLILAIALAAFLGPSLTNAMIAIGISSTPVFIRLTRGQVISLKGVEYIEAAHSIGLSHPAILVRYVLPNVMAPLLVQATLALATAIIAESSLSFLGLGQQPPMPSWGSMLNSAKGFLTQAPWMAICPGIAILLVVFGFNLLGDALRDALDPKEK